MALLDIDTTELKGKRITGAMLYLRSRSPVEAPVARLGVSTVGQSWVEGTSTRYRPQTGSSSFSQAQYGIQDWAYAGSTLMDVVFGKGNTLWGFSDCTTPDDEGWQACAVDPDVIAALAAGLSHGFCLFDEVGSTWSIKNNVFNYSIFPNRYLHSQESKGNGPWFEVWFDGEDHLPPNAVTNIQVDTQGLPGGQCVVKWRTPLDKGGGKTLGFLVGTIQGGVRNSVPRYMIPMAGEAGRTVRMLLQDLPFDPGEHIELSIQPVDSAGNIGPASRKMINLPTDVAMPNFKKEQLIPFKTSGEMLQVGDLKLAVVDLLDKIDPLRDRMIPVQKNGYKRSNSLYSAEQKKVALFGAGNETIYFQLILEGKAEDISLDMQFDLEESLQTALFRCGYVSLAQKQWQSKKFLPDPLLPISNTFSIPGKFKNGSIPGQKNQSIIAEIYIPHGTKPGTKRGVLTVMVGNEKLDITIDLTVWDFTLPDKLSFIPEMNAYSGSWSLDGYNYYRLAHQHRTCLNVLPYGWNGKPVFAPKWKEHRFDWHGWDRYVAPLLDGSAFKGLKRDTEPVAVMYLPFSENWPIEIKSHYSPSYWADEAFSESYRQELKQSFSAFAEHLRNNGWNNTIFQFYLNNKVSNRRHFAHNTAPWIFDEPVNTQDFWALRWYGQLWQDAVAPHRKDVPLWFRCDISYSQFARNLLWGIMDVEYTGGNNLQKIRMKHDEWRIWEKSHSFEYGSANKIEDANTQPVLWCLSAWSNGATGVLPWQTIGTEKSWVTADQTALFYPHDNGPMPSIRLKAFTVGQQFVEYLTLFMSVYNLPRHVMAEWLRTQLSIDGKVRKISGEDAGTAIFENVSPAVLLALKIRLGEMISAKSPPYRQALVNFTEGIPARRRAPTLGYVQPAPDVGSLKPDCDRF